MRRFAAVAAVFSALVGFQAEAHGGLTGGEAFVVIVLPLFGAFLALVVPPLLSRGPIGFRILKGTGLAIVALILFIGGLREHGNWPLTVIVALAYLPAAVYAIVAWRARRTR